MRSIFCLFAIVLLICSSTVAQSSAISQAVPAKWFVTTLLVCITNIADEKYERLFIQAMDEWKSVWPHFNYMLGRESNCNINVSLTKDYVELQNAGHAGVTSIDYYTNGAINRAYIIIPTQLKATVMQGPNCCRELYLEVSEKLFYITALHEFGHALNLGHSTLVENEVRDVMYPEASEDAEYKISKSTIAALDQAYGTSTDAEDRAVKITTSVTMEASIDKESYISDDKLVLSGTVSRTDGTGTVMIFDPSLALHALPIFKPKKDGTFSVEIPLNSESEGRWLLIVQFMGASGSTFFDLQVVPHKADGRTDKSTYSKGDLVKISGSVSRSLPVGHVLISVFNPKGVPFTTLDARVSPDKQFSTEFVLRDSPHLIGGSWTIRLAYVESTTDIHFELKSVEVQPVEEEAEGIAKLDVRVQAKQVGNLIQIRVRNTGDSATSVYGLDISVGGSLLQAVKVPKGWDKEIDMNYVSLSTSKSVLQPGAKIKFILKVDAGEPLVEWKAFGSDGQIVEGNLTPVLARR